MAVIAAMPTFESVDFHANLLLWRGACFCSGDVGADAQGPWSHPVGDGVLVRRISAVVFPVREGSGPSRTKQLAKIEEALRMGPSVAE